MPASPPATKRLPSWAWCLTLIGFPASLFIAYGFARILTWPRSIALALCCLGSTLFFGMAMGDIEQSPAHGSLLQIATLDAGVLIFLAWCWLLYHLGNDVSYWTPALQRSWRLAKWTAFLLIGLMLLPFVLFIAFRIL